MRTTARPLPAAARDRARWALAAIARLAARPHLTALEHDDQFAKAHQQLGLLDQRRGNYPAAESAFTAGLASEADDPLLLVNLAAARLSQGERWGARAIVARLDRVAPPTDRSTAELVTAARREIEMAVP